MKLFRVITALFTLSLSPILQATVIDFEGFAVGTIIDNEYFASLGVSINGVNVDYNPHEQNLGTIFDTNNYTGGDSDLAAPFSNSHGLGNLNPGNVLIIHEHPSECSNGTTCTDPDDEGSRPAGYFDIVFADAVTLQSIDFFDIETGENGSTPNNAIKLFGFGGLEIMANTFYTPDTGGNNTWDRLVFNVDGVKSMRINMGGSGAIDNINFVPEPTTLALLGLGLFGLGFNRRKRLH